MPEKSSWLEMLYPLRWQLLFLLLGLLFISVGVFIYKGDLFAQPSIEIVEDENSSKPLDNASLVVEVSGSVINPGVYSLNHGARIADALDAAGGVTEDADIAWVEKYVNRASVVVDGQKIYIPSHSDNSSDNENGGGNNGSTGVAGAESSMVNINTASQSELEALWGIGPVTAQSIIEQRMYSSVEELLTKGILKKNVYERNKEFLSVY